MIFQDFLIMRRVDLLYVPLVGFLEIVYLVDIVKFCFLELGVKAITEQFQL